MAAAAPHTARRAGRRAGRRAAAPPLPPPHPSSPADASNGRPRATTPSRPPRLDLENLDLPNLDLPRLDLPRLDLPNLDLPRLDLPRLDLDLEQISRTHLPPRCDLEYLEYLECSSAGGRECSC